VRNSSFKSRFDRRSAGSKHLCDPSNATQSATHEKEGRDKILRQLKQ
jgi:hypothetical protein